MAVSSEKLDEIFNRVCECLVGANNDGTLHQKLLALGLQGLINGDEEIDMGVADPAYGDILVFGNLATKKEALKSIANDMGYNRSRFRFVEYNEVTNFPFRSICQSTTCAAIMCGPVPHKATDMGDNASILEALRHQEDGWPPLAELRESNGTGELKVTKTTFRTALAELENRKAIRRDH